LVSRRACCPPKPGLDTGDPIFFLPFAPGEFRLVERCPRNFPLPSLSTLSRSSMAAVYPIKRVIGEDVVVEADIFKDGHDIVAAALKWRVVGYPQWHETAMRHVNNDRWRGVFSVYENATYEYTIEAWTNVFAGWVHEYAAKFEGGVADLMSETLEGAASSSPPPSAPGVPMRNACGNSPNRCAPARTPRSTVSRMRRA
jgi:hypothetical protein